MPPKMKVVELSPKQVRKCALPGKKRKTKARKDQAAEAAGLDCATVLRRLNKFLREGAVWHKQVFPPGASWSAESLPQPLLREARRLYIHFKANVKRAHASLVTKPAWEMATKKLKTKFRTALIFFLFTHFHLFTHLTVCAFPFSERVRERGGESEFDNVVRATLQHRARRSAAECCSFRAL